MRVLVCGSRDWNDWDVIKNFLKTLPPDTVVIEGGARGADNISRILAEELGMKVEEYPADWKKFGRAAGPIRNKIMLNKGKPTIVMAFHNDISHSRGTRNMIEQAMDRGIPIFIKRSKQ